MRTGDEVWLDVLSEDNIEYVSCYSDGLKSSFDCVNNRSDF